MRIILWFAILGFLFAMIGHAYSAQCRSRPGDDSYWSWRYIDEKKCWYRGDNGVMPKSKLHWSDEPERAPVRIKVPESIRAESPTTIIMPPMTKGDIVVPEFFTAQPATKWPLLIDIDEDRPSPDFGIDGCCWPKLEDLFADKWLNVPKNWQGKGGP